MVYHYYKIVYIIKLQLNEQLFKQKSEVTNTRKNKQESEVTKTDSFSKKEVTYRQMFKCKHAERQIDNTGAVWCN